MRVAVTGGCGFVGRAVVQELISRQHDVVCVDYQEGVDILSPHLIEHLRGCEAVIHLAGVLGTSELFERPDEAIDVNVKGTARVLHACSELGMRYVGITMPSVWDNVYQATRRAAFDLASAWHRHYGVPVSHVRAYNAFGLHQKTTGVQKIIPTFSVHAWRGQPLPIWGDGSQTVDLVYVQDIGRMMVDALQFGCGEVFDAGTGSTFTVNQVAQMVLDISGSTCGQVHHPMRLGEHEVSIVAKGEGWDKLGWKPLFDMDKLRETVRWYRGVLQ